MNHVASQEFWRFFSFRRQCSLLTCLLICLCQRPKAMIYPFPQTTKISQKQTTWIAAEENRGKRWGDFDKNRFPQREKYIIITSFLRSRVRYQLKCPKCYMLSMLFHNFSTPFKTFSLKTSPHPHAFMSLFSIPFLLCVALFYNAFINSRFINKQQNK